MVELAWGVEVSSRCRGLVSRCRGQGSGQRRRESFRILARSAEGRGRSTGPVARPDSTLLSVFHSWTIVSVTAVTFTARSVHSRAADPDTLHFQGSPRLEQGLNGDRHLASCGLPVYRYRAFRYSRREAWLRSDVIRALLARAVPCFPAVLYVYRFCRCDCRGGGGCSRAECRR